MTRWVRNLLIANVFVFFIQYTMPVITNPLVFVPRYALVRPRDRPKKQEAAERASEQDAERCHYPLAPTE